MSAWIWQNRHNFFILHPLQLRAVLALASMINTAGKTMLYMTKIYSSWVAANTKHMCCGIYLEFGKIFGADEH